MRLQLCLPYAYRLVLHISSFRMSLLPASADVCARSNHSVKYACPMLPFLAKGTLPLSKVWAELPFESGSKSPFFFARAYKLAHAHSTVTASTCCAFTDGQLTAFTTGYEPTTRFHCAKQQQQQSRSFRSQPAVHSGLLGAADSFLEAHSLQLQRSADSRPARAACGLDSRRFRAVTGRAARRSIVGSAQTRLQPRTARSAEQTLFQSQLRAQQQAAAHFSPELY